MEDDLAATRPDDGAARYVPGRSPLILGSVVFAAAYLYILPLAADLIDDHFMHVVWGRQLLYGRKPLLDMEALGLPLQAVLSAASERLVGYRMLSEGLVIGSAFATAAVLTFVVARAASQSLWIGALAAAFQVAIGPRTYGYPKILVYAAAIFILWRYIDRPSVHRAVVLGATIATAFYLRHDHGVYVAIATAAALALRHYPDWKRSIGRVALVGATSVMLVAPFLWYVQRSVGIDSYVRDLRSVAAREYQANRFDSWPAWPFASIEDVVEWRRSPHASATIGVRWNEGASDQARRAAAARYGLQVDQDEPIESGRFLLTNLSRANVLALLNDPAIDDTSDIDRASGAVPLQGLWIGRLHLLGGLDVPYASAGLLFVVFMGVLIGTAAALSRPGVWHHAATPHERIKISSVLLVGVLTCVGFIREPLAIRIPDAAVAPIILAAWWAGRWWTGLRSEASPCRRLLRASAAAVLVLPVIRATAVEGAIPTQIESVVRLPQTWQQLLSTPPVNAWQRVDTPKYQAVSYVRACTASHEPLLVLWFAPDLYYYSDRPFAGRLGFYIEGYWADDAAELRNIAALERDRPPIALMETDREVTDLYTYPRLLTYLAEAYRPIGRIPSNDGRSIEILARNDRRPSSTYGESGWPCFR